MTALTPRPDLETRLRAGLRAAGEALPPPPPSPARPVGPAAAHPPDVPRLHGHRPRTATLAAAAAAAVAVAGVGMIRLAGDDGAADVESAPADDPATTGRSAGPSDHRGPGKDPVAGSAVVTGDSLVTYGPDGEPGETVSLAPLRDVQSVVPDRHGGWIACGDRAGTGVLADVESIPIETWWDVAVGNPAIDEALAELEEALAEGEAAPAEPTVFRFRAGHEPEPLAINPWCTADALGVTLVEGRETLLYAAGAGITVHQLDLTTGTTDPVPLDLGTPLPGKATVGGGRIAVLDESGLRMWDLATAEPVAVPPVDLPVTTDLNAGPGTSKIELSPDGASLAALVGDLSSSEVVVLDLATGAELFRTTLPQPLEGDQLSYDGTSVAVGNWYEEYGPVRIFDVATGAERTIDAHGILP